MPSAALGVVAIEVAALLGARWSGVAGALADLGPAWLSGPLGSLAPWLTQVHLPAPTAWPHARAAVWAAVMTAALVARFRRLELPR